MRRYEEDTADVLHAHLYGGRVLFRLCVDVRRMGFRSASTADNVVIRLLVRLSGYGRN